MLEFVDAHVVFLSFVEAPDGVFAFSQPCFHCKRAELVNEIINLHFPALSVINCQYTKN